ncbi:hypothetical protein B0T24DRAFT_677197 [Lasiosphaeria ovina]|uniref:Uncharacterized protein n=1 Tax=Lasiosphaeria ovina TaxID=92902 RepID=A0AAE0NAN8_9PEZI|nr:hypothetical protein B0T24DRAFT_677197 [Lasiosphaeria ovina]
MAYYMPPLELVSDGSAPLGGGQTAEPCTVLTLERNMGASSIDLRIGFQTSEPDLDDADLQNALLRIESVRAFHIVRVPSSTPGLPPGPYFLHHGHLHHAYRLYPDTAGASIVATVLQTIIARNFRSLDMSAYDEEYPSALNIAVPSRLYFAKTREKPYAGLRLAIEDIIDLKGLQTGASPHVKFDTIGGFARTAGEFKVLEEALYGSPGIADTGVMKFEDTWRRKHRPDGVNESLEEYFEHIFEWAANPDRWTGLFKDSLAEHEARFGKPPVVNPQLHFKVEYLPTITPAQQAEAHAMPPADETGYSSTVLILPWTTGAPEYRNRYRDGPQQFTGIGFFFYNVGPYAEAPELIVPVGATPYVSKFTGRVESLPAALGLVGAKGSDVALARLVSAFLEQDDVGEAGVIGAVEETVQVPLV